MTDKKDRQDPTAQKPQEKKTKDPEAAKKDALKKEEKKKKEAIEKYNAGIDEMLKKADFTELDERRYSFNFDGGRFVFHLPNIIEKGRIKAILAHIAQDVPGINVFAGQTIAESGDLGLICICKLTTHIKVLLEEFPKNFDLEKLSEEEQFDLGFLILHAERRFEEAKKKPSSKEQ